MISPQQYNTMAAHKQLLANATMALSSDKKPELYCEKELRALGKSLECCVCMRLMESPARTRWYVTVVVVFPHLFLIFLKISPTQRALLLQNVHIGLRESEWIMPSV